MDIKQEVRDKATEEDGIYALEMVASILLNSVQKAGELSKEELKRVIYQEAEKNPEYFTDGSGNITIFDNEVMQRKYITLRAIKDGIIKKSPNNKSIVWGKDSKKIYTAPQGVDLVESLICRRCNNVLRWKDQYDNLIVELCILNYDLGSIS